MRMRAAAKQPASSSSSTDKHGRPCLLNLGETAAAARRKGKKSMATYSHEPQISLRNSQ